MTLTLTPVGLLFRRDGERGTCIDLKFRRVARTTGVDCTHDETVLGTLLYRIVGEARLRGPLNVVHRCQSTDRSSWALTHAPEELVFVGRRGRSHILETLIPANLHRLSVQLSNWFVRNRRDAVEYHSVSMRQRRRTCTALVARDHSSIQSLSVVQVERR